MFALRSQTEVDMTDIIFPSLHHMFSHVQRNATPRLHPTSVLMRTPCLLPLHNNSMSLSLSSTYTKNPSSDNTHFIPPQPQRIPKRRRDRQNPYASQASQPGDEFPSNRSVSFSLSNPQTPTRNIPTFFSQSVSRAETTTRKKEPRRTIHPKNLHQMNQGAMVPPP